MATPQRTRQIFSPLPDYLAESILDDTDEGRPRTWFARSTTGGPPAVLKLLPGTPLADSSRWLDRAWPGWARCRAIAQREGKTYLARDWVTGHPLSELMEDRSAPAGEDEARLLFGRLCRILAPLHTAGGVHGQIKPANLIVRGQWPFVTDPQVSNARAADAADDKTVETAIFGDPHYLSVEALRQAPLSPASDVYSIGCVLYEWLAGTPPFTAGAPILVCYQKLSGKAVHLLQRRPDLTASFAELVMRCLSADPKVRPADAATLERALTATLHDDDEPIPTTDGADHAASPPPGEESGAPHRMGEEGGPAGSTDAVPCRTGHFSRTSIISLRSLRQALQLAAESPSAGLDEIRERLATASMPIPSVTDTPAAATIAVSDAKLAEALGAPTACADSSPAVPTIAVDAEKIAAAHSPPPAEATAPAEEEASEVHDAPTILALDRNELLKAAGAARDPSPVDELDVAGREGGDEMGTVMIGAAALGEALRREEPPPPSKPGLVPAVGAPSPPTAQLRAPTTVMGRPSEVAVPVAPAHVTPESPPPRRGSTDAAIKRPVAPPPPPAAPARRNRWLIVIYVLLGYLAVMVLLLVVVLLRRSGAL